MPGSHFVLCLVLTALAGRPAQACECEVTFSSCREVKTSDLVFIGTVLSIEPLFLNRWSGAEQSAMRSLHELYIQAQERPSAETLRSLKDKYLATFPALDDREKKQVQAASSVEQMASFLSTSLDRGMRIHLQVKTLFKQGDEDNAAASTKEPKKDPDFLDIWTTFGDCGYDFQIGETYVVYADQEEGTDYFFTNTCTRTKRVSDAGDDLAYLYFYKDQPGASSRLEGFVTSDRKSQRFIDPMHDPSGIGSPVSGLIFQLHSTGLTRYAESDSNGRFVFDGLPEGSYDLSAFANGYPKTNQLLAGPRRLFMKEKSCARQVFVVPQAKSPPTH
jgi:hypothetical protein